MIHLKPEQWGWATWREVAPLPRPEPRPFDLNAFIDTIQTAKGGWYAALASVVADLQPGISRQEAHFWLSLIDGLWVSREIRDTTSLIQQVLDYTFDGQISADDVGVFFNNLNLRDALFASKLVIPYMALLDSKEIIALLCSDQVKQNFNQPYQHLETNGLILGILHYMLPYMAADEREQIRAYIAPMVAEESVIARQTQAKQCGPVLYLAAILGGFSGELERLVASLPDDREYQSRGQLGLIELIYGLDNPDKVEYHIRRLKQVINTGERAAGWLAHTETRALDWLETSIAQLSYGPATHVFETLALVDDDTVIPVMDSLKNCGRMVAIKAFQWVEARKIAALVPVSESNPESTPESNPESPPTTAVSYDWLIDGSLLEYKPRLRRSHQQPSSSMPLFSWFAFDELPPLLFEGKPLPYEQVTGVLRILTRSRLNAPHPLITRVKAYANREPLDHFVGVLLDLWMARGAPSTERWPLEAVGLLGGEESVAKLSVYVMRWTDKADRWRAIQAISCLRSVGTDSALLQLAQLARHGANGVLRQAANTSITEFARSCGLTREQLDDRIVPDCGLDADGRRIFDYGARKFTFVLNSGSKPMVWDKAGKSRVNLPKPTQKDDAELAERAQTDWQALKKQVRDTQNAQNARLERAFLTERRWTLEEFKTYILGQPMMAALARQMLWGIFDDSCAFNTAFRITEERDFADVSDTPIQLDHNARFIGLVHPLHMNAAERGRWIETFTDYHIVQPFPQVGRELYTVSSIGSSADATEWTHFGSAKTALHFVMSMHKLGWFAGSLGRHQLKQHRRNFQRAGVTAVIEHSPIPSRRYHRSDTVHLTSCYFWEGVHHTENPFPKRETPEEVRADRMPLGRIDPIVLSEALRDLHGVTK